MDCVYIYKIKIFTRDTKSLKYKIASQVTNHTLLSFDKMHYYFCNWDCHYNIENLKYNSHLFLFVYDLFSFFLHILSLCIHICINIYIIITFHIFHKFFSKVYFGVQWLKEIHMVTKVPYLFDLVQWNFQCFQRPQHLL